MLADAGRTVLVVGARGNLWSALHDAIPSSAALVRWCPVDEARDAIRECAPWPWAVACDLPEAPAELEKCIHGFPVMAHWLGPVPAGLSGIVPSHRRWQDLSAAIRGALGNEVNGLRLAPGSGLLTGDGARLRSPALEALVASYPVPVRLTPSTVAGARRSLRRHRVPVTVVGDPAAAALCGVPGG